MTMINADAEEGFSEGISASFATTDRPRDGVSFLLVAAATRLALLVRSRVYASRMRAKWCGTRYSQWEALGRPEARAYGMC